MRITIEITADSTPEDILSASNMLVDFARAKDEQVRGLAQPLPQSEGQQVAAPLPPVPPSLALDKGGVKAKETTGPSPQELFGGTNNAPSPANAATSTSAPADTPDSSAPPSNDVPDAPSSAPPPTSATLAPTVERDAAGMPWDERIHSSGKTKVKAGTWRYKGGVHAAEIKRIEAEVLRQADAPVPAPSVPPVPTADASAPAPATPPVPPTPSVPPVPGVPRNATPPVGVLTFAGVVKRVAAAQDAGKLSQSTVSETLQALGYNSLSDLVPHPDQYGAVVQALGV